MSSSSKIITSDIESGIVDLRGQRIAGDVLDFTIHDSQGIALGVGRTPVEAMTNALQTLAHGYAQLARDAELAKAAFTVLQQQLVIADIKLEILESRTLRGRLRRFGNWLMSWTQFVADEVDPVLECCTQCGQPKNRTRGEPSEEREKDWPHCVNPKCVAFNEPKASASFRPASEVAAEQKS